MDKMCLAEPRRVDTHSQTKELPDSATQIKLAFENKLETAQESSCSRVENNLGSRRGVFGGKQERARIIEILRLAGAKSATANQSGLRVQWPDATPWFLLLQHDGQRPIADAWMRMEELAEPDACFHLVTLSGSQLAAVDHEDVRRALDIQRRGRVCKARDGLDFGIDDAFAQHVKLRVLRMLQAALELSSAAMLLRLRGRPIVGPGDNELLVAGPSIGFGAECDEHFLEGLRSLFQGDDVVEPTQESLW